MVVSPCTTFTLPEKVASFLLSRISSVAASIRTGWSLFCENPCIALGTPCAAPCAMAVQAVASVRRKAIVNDERVEIAGRSVKSLDMRLLLQRNLLDWNGADGVC